MYPTAEHFMMAEKARLFGDLDILGQILKTESPRRVKRLGRQVRGFDDTVWKENCREIVFQGNLAKFRQHKDLKKILLETGDKVIAEASPVDAIWGIGMAEHDPRARNPKKWRGTNWLGEALMRVREELRKEEPQKEEGKAGEARERR